jgi:galactitol-specific phosphotransferase system IIC component
MEGIGYQLGLSGTRSLIAILALALTFSGVMVLIADLDRHGQGLIKVSQRAMIDLQKQMTGQAH